MTTANVRASVTQMFDQMFGSIDSMQLGAVDGTQVPDLNGEGVCCAIRITDVDSTSIISHYISG